MWRLRLLAAVCFSFSVLACTLLSPRYTLSLLVENPERGSIICDPEAADYREYSLISLKAVANQGYSFSHWNGAGEGYSAETVVLMDAHRKVTAYFDYEIPRNNPTDNLQIPFETQFSPSADETWTFMVYLDGDNNLESYALVDLNEMEEGIQRSGNSSMEVIVLLDRRDDGAADSEWKDCRYYRVRPDNSDAILSERVDAGDLGELNLGDPAVLSNFIVFCREEFPADHYALMLWNHGGGARSLSSSFEGTVTPRQICEDDSASGDSLFLDEIQQALESGAPEGLDLISMDACLMGTVETAYELRARADYFVASMSDVSAAGWDYGELFGSMSPGPAGCADSRSLSELMVTAYSESVVSRTDQSISAIELSRMEPLKSSIDKLAEELYLSDNKSFIEDIRNKTIHFFNRSIVSETIQQPYYDLNDFLYLLIENSGRFGSDVEEAAEEVLEELSLAVAAAYGGTELGNYRGPGSVVKRGLSIFISNGEQYYNGLSHYSYQYWYTDLIPATGPYGLIDFCTSDNDSLVKSWRELMECWYDPFRPPLGFTPGSW
ncbi:MAG: hypothetical protein JXR86_17515 [Spirochaetales bacterium]|nr:hypothetical protein [Spirochaetales bacterium]